MPRISKSLKFSLAVEIYHNQEEKGNDLEMDE